MLDQRLRVVRLTQVWLTPYCVAASLRLHRPPSLAARHTTMRVQPILTSFPRRLRLRFIPKLSGVLLAHSDLRFLEDKATIQADCPFAVVDVRFGALVWAPEVGQVLCALSFLLGSSRPSADARPISLAPQPARTLSRRRRTSRSSSTRRSMSRSRSTTSRLRSMHLTARSPRTRTRRPRLSRRCSASRARPRTMRTRKSARRRATGRRGGRRRARAGGRIAQPAGLSAPRASSSSSLSLGASFFLSGKILVRPD